MQFSKSKSMLGLMFGSLALATLGTLLPVYAEASPVQAQEIETLGVNQTLNQQDKTYLEVVQTRLNDNTSAANVRSGPGLDFEVLGLINDTDIITVTGRAENSNWLQIDYWGEVGWLSGELIYNPSLGLLVRPVNTDQIVEETSDLVEVEVAETTPTSITCAATPIRGFGETWQNHPEVRPLLGCPFTNWRQDEHATPAAVQTFERGWMLWLETDTVANVDPIYVFFEDDGSYMRYGDRPLVDAHSYAPTPLGFYKAGDRFAKVYWEELDDIERTRLGYATNEARDSLGAFQEFDNGRMFWAGEADTIYVIYDGYYDFDGDGEYQHQRSWLAYEDTFEDVEQ